MKKIYIFKVCYYVILISVRDSYSKERNVMYDLRRFIL